MSQLEELHARAQTGVLQEGDALVIKGLIECVKVLGQAVDEKAATIKKLLRGIFGPSTEKKDNVLKDKKKQTDDENDDSDANGDSPNPADDSPNPADKSKKKKKRKGHGRNGAEDYPGAKRVGVEHPDLQNGSACPKCLEGKLYTIKPGTEIRITGTAPLQGTVYEREKFRCSLCLEIFTAPMPEDAPVNKYDASAATMIALLKYGRGMPFYRLEGLQGNLGIPLPASTQWEQVNEQAQHLKPVFQEFIKQAAEGEVLHDDDTYVKILSLIKENKTENPERKGMFTTGIVSLNEERTIILFFSGRNYAGENMDEVLEHRDAEEKPPPLQMCDGLINRNVPKQFKTILALCLVHARRNFVNAAPSFPEECAVVLEILAEVYKFDADTKDGNMSPEERLRYHQENSGPLMEKLGVWLEERSQDEKIEENSNLGKAIVYMLKHWKELTAFLRIPNAPLDNNICERALKKAILHRKNALFFKNANGAFVGDLYMSLIYTCESAGVNSFEYLTALMEHHERIQDAPAEWMPWNFKETLSKPAA